MVCPPSRGAEPCAGIMRSAGFCSRHLRNGGWFAVFLYLIVPNYPSRACLQLMLVPYSSSVFYCSRRRLSRCRHSGKGPQVSAYLTWKERSRGFHN